MVPIRVLLLIAIPLIGIFLQKSSCKGVDESNHQVESSPDLEGDHEVIRTKRDVDNTIADMTEYKRPLGDSALSNGDETEEIEKRRIGRWRRLIRRKPGRRRRPNMRRIFGGAGDIIGAVDTGMKIADLLRNNG
ncbi:uncharacterized protein LOC125657467 isoform X1 [Ostrea edulis]|uniref:uncharacterized protein LOC125657467 isoform X1 n=1 Tax=Ostrea edulis TaxID=37623 RepID=UPI0024AFBABE|nr:uncharacterized protein LOC125657467 isoform X1 [Ostrea edulis]